jgi:hydrogenase maturation protease
VGPASPDPGTDSATALGVNTARTVIVGFGNPYCGDDGIGPAAARALHAALDSGSPVGLLELSSSALELVEQLAGYDRAVVIDAVIDEEAPLGAVKRLSFIAGRALPGLGFHTAGLGSALALARALGMEIPASVELYGVVIREPRTFTESLSHELSSKLPEIVETILMALRNA